MTKDQNITLWILIIFGLLFFIIFYFPNSVASDNIPMVGMFEPDESVPLGVIFKMISPAETIKKTLINFFFYNYHFYGFPYFAYSALTILPLHFSGQLNNIPLVMTILRQAVSVLPMILAILLLVYLQTQFKSRTKTIISFIFMLSIPVITKNNMWWHPDSLTILLVVLTIYFLTRDDLRFGWRYFIAAFMCGVTVGTKLVGLFFFITIPTYILWGFFTNRINLKKALFVAMLFVLVMALAVLASNPTLIYKSIRESYIRYLEIQNRAIKLGYEILYDRGLGITNRLSKIYYAHSIVLLLAVFGLIWGIVRNRNRLLNIIILTWAFPFYIYLAFFTALQYQYLIPVYLPVLSGISMVFTYIEEKWKQVKTENKKLRFPWRKIIAALFTLLITAQFIFNLNQDLKFYEAKLFRAERSESLKFYQSFSEEIVPFLPKNKSLGIYKDPRLYLPESDQWRAFTKFEMLDYEYFQENNPDLILLVQQRIYDYTNEKAVEKAIDRERMDRSYKFYTDANQGKLDGYVLIFRDDFGLAFIKKELFSEF